ncbi:hypothetical protein ABAC402_15855 [Asticcacaulis sp. AC402]|nr:hypothetical protein ABAC402_15855 [Asticcacaulis sp. AC402]
MNIFFFLLHIPSMGSGVARAMASKRRSKIVALPAGEARDGGVPLRKECQSQSGLVLIQKRERLSGASHVLD